MFMFMVVRLFVAFVCVVAVIGAGVVFLLVGMVSVSVGFFDVSAVGGCPVARRIAYTDRLEL